MKIDTVELSETTGLGSGGICIGEYTYITSVLDLTMVPVSSEQPYVRISSAMHLVAKGTCESGLSTHWTPYFFFQFMLLIQSV